MAFVKLDTGILNSTLWDDRAGRDVFITALLMAEPIELTEPTPTLQVRAIEDGGFTIPPGWYGMVHAAGVGIIRQSLVDTTEGMDALDRLSAPESGSRSQDFDGRRLVRIDGGFIVLNYMKYRDRDYSAAIRSQRYRERKKEKASRVTITPVTQAEAEAEADTKGGKRPPSVKGKAAHILRRIRALAEERGGSVGGKMIRRDHVGGMGPQILAAYDAVGGAERVLGAVGREVSFLTTEFAAAMEAWEP